MTARLRRIATAVAIAALAGCKSSGELVVNQGVGITALRTACPAVGIPDYTGDVTLFRGAGRNAEDIDVIAAMTNMRSQCDDTGERVYSQATFDVMARRSDTRGARTVELPYFSAVMRGGSSVVSKRLGTVRISFADGQERAQAVATAGAYIDRSEATLPPDIVRQINRKRRAGDEDAEAQLAYNATR